MAKASGSIRKGNHFEWNRSDDFEDMLSDSKKIFEIEAAEGLGNFKQRKPQIVDAEKYKKLLDSGDYIEVRHGGEKEHVEQMISGKYYVNDDIMNYGFGYYFRAGKGISNYTHVNGTSVSALIKKSDVVHKNEVEQIMRKGQERFLGDGLLKNGENLSERDRRDMYNYTTAVAKSGAKVLATDNHFGDYVIIDRSALIIKKK